MLRRDPLRSLPRKAWATRLTRRNRPLARPVSPRLSPLRMNRSNKGTGSGLDHSPSSQALYQPTDPEVLSRTSERQLCSRTTGIGPGARPPSSRRDPSGSITSIPPSLRPASIRSRTPRNRRPTKRASSPPPVAKPRSAETRWRPRACWFMSSPTGESPSAHVLERVRLFSHHPALALRDERLEVGGLARRRLRVLLAHRGLEGRRGIVV